MLFELSLRKNTKIVVIANENLEKEDLEFVAKWMARLGLDSTEEAVEQKRAADSRKWKQLARKNKSKSKKVAPAKSG
jgi:hypothetical protein